MAKDPYYVILQESAPRGFYSELIFKWGKAYEEALAASDMYFDNPEAEPVTFVPDMNRLLLERNLRQICDDFGVRWTVERNAKNFPFTAVWAKNLALTQSKVNDAEEVPPKAKFRIDYSDKFQRGFFDEADDSKPSDYANYGIICSKPQFDDIGAPEFINIGFPEIGCKKFKRIIDLIAYCAEVEKRTAFTVTTNLVTKKKQIRAKKGDIAADSGDHK